MDIKTAYMQGYEKGHHDTVEGGTFCPEESADDWIAELVIESRAEPKTEDPTTKALMNPVTVAEVRAEMPPTWLCAECRDQWIRHCIAPPIEPENSGLVITGDSATYNGNPCKTISMSDTEIILQLPKHGTEPKTGEPPHSTEEN